MKKTPLLLLSLTSSLLVVEAFPAKAQIDIRSYSSADLQRYALHTSQGCITGKLTSGDEGASVQDLCAYAIQYIREIERRRGYR